MNWHGSWRNSYIATFLRPSTIPESTPLPSHGITTPTLHSDVLFQPHLCAAFDPTTIFNAPSFVPTVPHLDGRLLTPDQLPTTPCIFTHLMDDWKSMDPTSSRRWELSKLVSRFPGIKFRAEATLTGLAEYQGYHDACEQDESPLYLFESEFVEKTIGRDEGLGDDYEVPLCFQEDLFEVMGAERPDYRWLVSRIHFPPRIPSLIWCADRRTNSIRLNMASRSQLHLRLERSDNRSKSLGHVPSLRHAPRSLRQRRSSRGRGATQSCWSVLD